MPTLAFPHDHSTPVSGRKIEIDGKEYSYLNQIVSPGVATVSDLPATAAPIEVLDGHSGVQLPTASRPASWYCIREDEDRHCKDVSRRGDFPNISFDFLGFQFRARKTMGRKFAGLAPFRI
jgi:hypothetical protein